MFNLLSFLPLMAAGQQAPGASNPLSQAPVQGPSAPVPEQETRLFGKSREWWRDFALGLQIGQLAKQGNDAAAASLLNSAMARQQQMYRNEAAAKGVAAVQEALRADDPERAAGVVEQLGALGYLDDKAALRLGSLIDAVRQKKQARDAQMGLLKARAIYQQGGPDALSSALQSDPQLSSTLAAYPGGVAKLFEELAPKREVKEGMVVTNPSPIIGGEPTIKGLPTPPKLDDDTKKILAGWGVDENDVKQAYLNGDEATKKMVQTALSKSRAESAFKRLGLESNIASVLASRGLDPNKVASQLEGGDPADSMRASQLITQARAEVQKEKVDLAVREANAKAIADRNLKANDPYKIPGHVAYDQQTGELVHLTNAMAQNPNNFAANGGRIVLMPEKNQEQMELMQSQMIPGINRAKELANKILSKADVLNLPQGAKLTAQGWAGSADVKQFQEVIRHLAVEAGRIEGGSVRIPVTMLNQLRDTLPSTYTSYKAALVMLDTLGVAAENRRRSYLHRTDFLPLPGGTATGNTSIQAAGRDNRKAADFLK